MADDDTTEKKSGQKKRLDYVKKWQKRLETDFQALRKKRSEALIREYQK